ncbi:phosphoenolpyruvate carboxykinase (ATP) [Ancylobacter amanitiformis]|uniref:Phosphoenolpyruvate carboxykinase (ATP) n=1 Tax=Ancylobacter amanitiformis TaxID=217069 RepID=A0ABU0LTL8_9HYPH|nr:phosphoenolpyruvate carboxykinase (ATP) [Ancylobacter amanitiformis]MDQ0512062.1 phosphoenolpyruvate carboxykinase (ATP) [Ancylobacter amanitiformis]
MHQTGTRNEQHGIEAIGLAGTGKVFWNLAEAALCERSIARGESHMSAFGALVADSGAPAGRSPEDRFIVRDEASEADVWWDNVNALSRETFEQLKADALAHAGGRTLFAQDLEAGADPAFRTPVRVFTEHAWQALFIRDLLHRPDSAELATFVPELTVLCLPSFRAEPDRHGVRSRTVIACDLTGGLVLIGGTQHAGEMAKAIFSVLTYTLPARGVLPLHAAANMGEAGDVALFIGESGAGKTALAADATRLLIGDDETGWSRTGVFNVENGCCVRTQGLAAAEPALAAAAQQFGAVLENVALDGDTRLPMFDAPARAEGARAVFPLAALAHAAPEARGAAPRHLFLLVQDPHGVLPPLARLTPAQALYHFLSGYTAGPTDAAEPEVRFSAGFSGSLLLRHPSTYGRQLRELIGARDVECWIVNTGWTGGKAGTGRRMPIEVTRHLVAAVLEDRLMEAEWRTDPHFGFAVPMAVEGVDSRLLDPARGWASRMDYAMTARRLVSLFSDNFARFENAVDDEIRHAQPGMAIAAE